MLNKEETMRMLDVLWEERRQRREMTAATEVGVPIDTVPEEEEFDDRETVMDDDQYAEETHRIFRSEDYDAAEMNVADVDVRQYGPKVWVLVLDDEIVGVYDNARAADKGAWNKSRAEAERVPGSTATVRSYEWPVLS